MLIFALFSHMRKLTSGVDKGKFVRLETEKTSKKLENEQTRNLSDMPSSITLNRQPYRHVDNVCFSNREIMERFLEEWRNTGQQQVGWLMGKYVKYDEVPLGIKVCLFIWQEVSQESFNIRQSLKHNEYYMYSPVHGIIFHVKIRKK